MLSPIENAILLTAFLGVLCIAVSRRLNGTYVSACTFFWIAWFSFLLAARYCEWQEIISAVTDGSTRLVELGELGAAAGCLLGSSAAGRLTKKEQRQERLQEVKLGQKGIYTWMAVIASVGILYLLETLSRVGWNLLTLLFDIRSLYIAEGLTPLGKVSEYVAAGTIPLAILLARRDVDTGIRPLPIVLLILANAPIGFATGGRGYLVAPLIYYGCAYLLGTRWRTPIAGAKEPAKGNSLWKVVLLLLSVFLIFTGVGEWRWGITEDRPFYLRTVDTVLSYPAVSIKSIEEFSETFSDTAADGRLLLNWPASQIERVGILSTDTRDDLVSSRDTVFKLYGGVSNYPPTIIPYLIGDFGLALMPLYFALITAVTQFATVRVRVKGLLGHSIATMALFATCMSIQDTMFFTSAHCLALLWVGVIVLSTKKKSQMRDVHVGVSESQNMLRGISLKNSDARGV